MSNLTDLVTVAKSAVESIGKSFTDPADDWRPVLIMLDKHDQVTLVDFDAMMTTAESKDETATKLLPQLLREHEAKAFVTVLSSYGVYVDDSTKLAGSVKDTPGRFELIVLTCMSAHKCEMWSAKIVRHEDKPPTLEPWVRDPDDAVHTGRFFEPLARAIRPQG